MRIAQLIAPHQFEIVDEPLPDPGPGEVQVRIEHVGICGSDLHSYSEGAVGATPSSFPLVLGHEPSGTVLKTGPGVTGWQPGDRAAFEPAIYCYHCEHCLAGRHNVCSNLRFMSAAGVPGFFREAANIPVRSLQSLPPSLPLRDAVLIEPLSVVLHSMKFIDLRIGEDVAVFGAGPIGLMTVICVKLAGARRVWSVEPVAHRREMALAAGADCAIDPNAADPVKTIRAETGGRGVDAVVDCAAQGNSINQCVHVVRPAGRFVLTGIPSGVLTPLEISPLRMNEITLYNVRRSNHNSDAALDLIVAHHARFAPMITHEFPLERIGDAFAVNERYNDGAGKIVIG
ncbi:MAG: zinc-binding dehydrogenase [Bryobacteraceae bacterium]